MRNMNTVCAWRHHGIGNREFAFPVAIFRGYLENWASGNKDREIFVARFAVNSEKVASEIENSLFPLPETKIRRCWKKVLAMTDRP